MVMAISKAVEEGDKAVICASTGNTSASAAAYGAVAGLEVIIVLPKGKIALGKMIQAIAAGAKVLAVDGNFDDALSVVREMAEQKDHPVTLVNHRSTRTGSRARRRPRTRSATTSAARPDILAIPVGNAGNITAYWARLQSIRRRRPDRAPSPKMYGFQAAGAAPIVLGHPDRESRDDRHGHPHRQPGQLEAGRVAARDESGGLIDMVTDDEILAAYRELATTQGIFCEPASAASLAGRLKLAAAGRVPAGRHGRLRPDGPRPQGSGDGRDDLRRRRRRDHRGGADHRRRDEGPGLVEGRTPPACRRCIAAPAFVPDSNGGSARSDPRRIGTRIQRLLPRRSARRRPTSSLRAEIRRARAAPPCRRGGSVEPYATRVGESAGFRAGRGR